MIRFIHSSDLHLGKPFGRFAGDVPGLLRKARAEVLDTLAGLARTHEASHILLAGDTFDQTTPAPEVIRQALNQMRAAAHVTWVLMPGNHDHSNASELWGQVAQDAPDNVLVLLEPEPVVLRQGYVLLPAPPSERHPGRDLTEWFDSAETGDAVRIGLAHGSVTDFDSSEEGGSSVIAPDRAERAGLAYLALGDWHGQLKIGARTWYSGAPEADGFKHDHAPSALLVEIAEALEVRPLATGKMSWRRVSLEMDAARDAAQAVEEALPPLAERATYLLDVQVSGRASPVQRVALEQAVARAGPDFLWCNLDVSSLGMVFDTNDLDQIDGQGALRASAEALVAEAGDETLSEAERDVARAALSHLFSYAMEG